MGCGSSVTVDENANRAPGYKGPVFITVVHALLERDVKFLGTMDPYVTLKMGARQTFKTPVCEEGGKHPKWDNASTTFMKTLADDDVIIGQVWSKNTVITDVLIGEGAFSLTRMRKGNPKPTRVEFLLFFNGEAAGTMSLDVTFTPDPSAQNLPEIKAPDTNGKLIVKPLYATLKRDVNFALKMDPLCTIRFGNENMSTSVNNGGGKTPKWSDTLIFTRETDEDTLFVEVWSEALLGSNDFLGNGYISITDALSLNEDVRKVIKLTYLNEPAGELELIYTFKTADPQKYMAVLNAQAPVTIPPNQAGQQQQPIQQQPMGQQQQRSEQPMMQQQQQQYPPPQPYVMPQQLLMFQQRAAIQMPTDGHVDYTYPNGDRYVGQFQGSLKNGQGRLTYSYGGYYEGMWQNDLPNGIGELVTGDTKYNGQFINGKKNGQGQQMWHNGQGYNGSWLDNNMHGKGDWIFPNGAKKAGLYANGQRIRWVDDDQNVVQPNQTKTSGFQLNSPSGEYTMIFQPDGRLFVMHNPSRQSVFAAIQFNRPIFPPFWLRFDPIGQLQLIDASGRPYWISGEGPGFFAPPFVLALQDDGKLVIRDVNGLIKWYSQ